MSDNLHELPPPMPKDPKYVAPPRDSERPGPHIVAEIIPLEDQLKVGHVQGFTVRCDESGRIGGEDSAPSPLGYFTVAIGFWLATQIVQVARALRIEPHNVRIKVTAKYYREGSVLAGNAQTTCDSITTELSLDSSEPPERVAQLIKMAEATCFTINALRNPAPVALHATVNGQPFNLAGDGKGEPSTYDPRACSSESTLMA